MLITTLLAVSAMAKNPVDLSWLGGYWLTCENNREVSETWTDMRGGMLFGSSVTFHGGQMSWEFTRIAPTPQGYTFFAQPSGQPAAEFRLVRSSASEVVFENLKHDFPQRVIYRRTGDQLLGRVEGNVNGKLRVAEWHYRAAPLNSRCWTKPAPPPSRKRLRTLENQ